MEVEIENGVGEQVDTSDIINDMAIEETNDAELKRIGEEEEILWSKYNVIKTENNAFFQSFDLKFEVTWGGRKNE